MPALSLPMAELAGIVIHSTLYGFYTLLFIGSLYVFLIRQKEGYRPVNKYLFTVDIVLFISITAHWIIQVDRLFDAFIYHTNEPGGAAAYYHDAREPKFVTKSAFYVVQMFVGDTTMVYRLYVVWGSDWRIIVLPAITTAMLTIAGINVVVSFARQAPGVDIFTSASGRWIMTCFGTTLFTNVLVTSLISWRVWSINRQLGPVNRRNIRPIILVIVESASIYTACLLMTHISYLAKAPFQFVALDATSPAIGIAFALIIVRVGLGISAEQYTIAVSTRVINDLGVHEAPGHLHRVSCIQFARSGSPEESRVAHDLETSRKGSDEKDLDTAEKSQIHAAGIC